MLSGRENVPNTVVIRVSLIFIETTSTSEATKAAFEVVDQGSRRVGVFAGWSNARAEMDVMVDR